MARGSNVKKGMRPGGRKKGTPNRATVERVEQARIAVEQARGRNVKLGKDVLEEFMMLFADIARHHMPRVPGLPMPEHGKPNEEKFLTYAKLAAATAKDLADYQSPKFKAIAIATAPGTPGAGAESEAGVLDSAKIINMRDAVSMTRVYQRLIKKPAGL